MTSLFRDPKSIYNPFVYIAGAEALLAGLLIIVLTAVPAWLSQSWLDGLLDLHYGPKAPFLLHLAMGMSNWLSAVIILTPVGMFLSPSRVRVIDMAGTLALARFPMLIAVCLGFLKAPRKIAEWAIHTFLQQGEPIMLAWTDILIAGFAITIIVCMIVWMVALMYNAYKLSANISGTRAGVSFTLAFVAAYILSKVSAGLLAQHFPAT